MTILLKKHAFKLLVIVVFLFILLCIVPIVNSQTYFCTNNLRFKNIITFVGVIKFETFKESLISEELARNGLIKPDNWFFQNGFKLYSIKVQTSDGSVFYECKNLLDIVSMEGFIKKKIQKEKAHLKDMSIYKAFEENISLDDKEKIAGELIKEIFNYEKMKRLNLQR